MALSKNAALLESFTAYCHRKPEQRFFQALRNWAAIEIDPRIKSVLVDIAVPGDIYDLEDTFYWTEDRISEKHEN